MQFTLANDLLTPPMAAQPTANPATNPTQNLAAAVIKQAVTDATSHRSNPGSGSRLAFSWPDLPHSRNGARSPG